VPGLPNFGRNPSIPVTLFHQGKEYKGQFAEVMEAGAYTWHLTINRCYRGTMIWTQVSTGWEPVEPKDAKYELRLVTHKGDLDYLANEFIEFVYCLVPVTYVTAFQLQNEPIKIRVIVWQSFRLFR
jgi:hypothetical protein